jgi:hypothetical protein
MIRVGFSRARGAWAILSRVIMAITGRPYSHVWLLLEGSDAVRGVPMVLEASIEGYRLVPYEHFARGRDVVRVLDSPIPLGRAVDAAMARLGAAYAAMGLVGAGWVVAARRWARKRVRQPFRSPDAMFCSEAVAVIMIEAGYPIDAETDPEAVTPGDIEDWIRAAQDGAGTGVARWGR